MELEENTKFLFGFIKLQTLSYFKKQKGNAYAICSSGIFLSYCKKNILNISTTIIKRNISITIQRKRQKRFYNRYEDINIHIVVVDTK